MFIAHYTYLYYWCWFIVFLLLSEDFASRALCK